MKLSKNFCWAIFQKAAKNKDPNFITDGWMYDIIYIGQGYMMANKRRPTKEDITTDSCGHIANMPDGTPLYFTDGLYKPLPKKDNK